MRIRYLALFAFGLFASTPSVFAYAQFMVGNLPTATVTVGGQTELAGSITLEQVSSGGQSVEGTININYGKRITNPYESISITGTGNYSVGVNIDIANSDRSFGILAIHVPAGALNGGFTISGVRLFIAFSGNPISALVSSTNNTIVVGQTNPMVILAMAPGIGSVTTTVGLIDRATGTIKAQPVINVVEGYRDAFRAQGAGDTTSVLVRFRMYQPPPQGVTITFPATVDVGDVTWTTTDASGGALGTDIDITLTSPSQEVYYGISSGTPLSEVETLSIPLTLSVSGSATLPLLEIPIRIECGLGPVGPTYGEGGEVIASPIPRFALSEIGPVVLFEIRETADISLTERNTLIDIYSNSNGPNWTVDTSWLGYAGSECSWYGVVCNEARTAIQYLNLGENRLNGSISSAIGNLTNLRVANFPFNRLSGNVPATFGNLANLISLNLSSNHLRGSIPVQLENLSELSVLDISYNALFTTDSNLLNFLNSKQPGWQNTQTIAPTNMSAAPQSDSSILISWTPILFTSESGRYEVYYGSTSGGPYVFAGSTSTKLASSFPVTGLYPATAYYFVVRTVTDPNNHNQNTVISEYGVEVSAATNPSLPSRTISLGAGGATSYNTAGSAEATEVGYASLEVSSGETPYATAVFSFKKDGVTVTEAGVPASPPTMRARIFIDYRSDANAVPGREDAGKIDVDTGIAVVNCSDTAANVTYTLHDVNGSFITGGTGTIPAGHHFARFIDQLDEIASGFALPSGFKKEIQFASLEINSDQFLSILALRMTANQKNDILYTTTPVADLNQSLTADPIYFAQFADGGGYTSSLILLNTSNAAETGILQIFDNHGLPLSVTPVGGATDSSFDYSIPAGGVYLLRTDGSPVDAKVGWIQLIPGEGTSTPVGSGVFGYNQANKLVSESGVPAALATTHARVYVDLSRNHNTGIAIANLENTAAEIVIEAFERDGVTSVGTSDGPLPLVANGHEAKFADEFISGLPAGFTGVLDVSSATPFAALTIRSLNNEDDEFLMTAFPVADVTRPAPSPIVFPQIADGGGYTSEFILISPAGEASTVLRLSDETGASFELGD